MHSCVQSNEVMFTMQHHIRNTLATAVRTAPSRLHALHASPVAAFGAVLAPQASRAAHTKILTAPHFRELGKVTKNTQDDYTLSHSVYSTEEAASVEQTHLPPANFRDRWALAALRLVRGTFDTLTSYGHNMTASKYITRIIFLETVAGVPGMCGAMLRHAKSLRSMSRDHGFIHTLLEEAENERMHLLTFLELRKPGAFMRAAVMLTQGIFFNAYFATYIIAPRMCHRFVGYLEEEAVKTYTKIIDEYDAGKIPEWKDKPAPDIAKKYWRLKADATMRDLLLAVRADESIHRDVNHAFATLADGQPNPFK